MERYRELLSRPRLSVISAELDHELERIARIIQPSVRIDGRAELEVVFGHLLAASEGVETVTPKTLDLVGHSTAGGALLRLGDWVIDAASPTVTAFFRELADLDVVSRLGIHGVRLLGCRTADTGPGRSTICKLSDILGVECFGTNHLLYDAHYDAQGFRDAWKFLLVCSSDLRRTTSEAAVVPEAARWPRTLDIDALPALPIGPRSAQWPTRVATAEAARQLLRLIDRDAGAQMPGLLATPACELALPSATAGAYHVAHVLLDGAFVRFYPGGPAEPGVVYPIDDASALRRIIDELPVAVSRWPHTACPD
jgi:hypothetical protein